MNFGNLKVMARGSVLEANIKKVPTNILELILNMATVEIAADLVCLPKSAKFDATADDGEYLLHEILPDFLTMDKPGLHWQNGSKWQDLDPSTIEALDEKEYPNWRDVDSGTPRLYSQDGNLLRVVPAPDTTLTGGFWLFYGAKPPEMTSDAQYPFGGVTEIPRLTILTSTIIAYYKKMVLPILKKYEEAALAEKSYSAEIDKKRGMLNKRRDMLGYDRARMRGPFVC